MSSINNKLPNGWVETTLGEICKVGDGAHSKVERIEKGILYLTAKNFSNGNLKLDNVDYISKVDYNRLFPIKSRAVTRVVENDVLMGIIGSFGNAYRYKKGDEFGISSSVAILRPKESVLYPVFLELYMNSVLFRKIHKTYSSGSVQGYSNIPTIKTMPIIVPPLLEQKAIAKVLTAFDAKIENLQAQNKTLEQTAQTIFKEWFGLYQVGDVLPEGWRVGKLGVMVNLKSGYAFKSKDFVEESSFKALKIKDLKGKGNVSISDVSSVTEECTKIERVQFFKLKAGDIVLAMSGNTTGKIGVVPPHKKEIYLNQRVGKFFLKDDKWNSFLYNFLMSGNYEEKILAMGYGSAQPNISPTQIENIDIILPNSKKEQEYLAISNPIFDKVLVNNKQIQTLTKTRDTLLPKLMSGELRVNEFKS